MHVPEEEASAEEESVLKMREELVLEARGVTVLETDEELVLKEELWRDEIDDE